MARPISTERAKDRLVSFLNAHAYEVIDRCLPDAAQDVLSRHADYVHQLIGDAHPIKIGVEVLMAATEAMISAMPDYKAAIIERLIEELGELKS